MKSVIFLGDGMSDHPIERLDGRTPLQVASKPNIDRIAREGRTGLFVTIPEGQPNGSAVGNLSVMGYDPVTTYQGRAVLEAASISSSLRRKATANSRRFRAENLRLLPRPSAS